MAATELQVFENKVVKEIPRGEGEKKGIIILKAQFLVLLKTNEI